MVGLETIDLLKEEIDVAIRAVESVDPGFVAIKLAPNKRAFCASPGYLARHGQPKRPQELSKHQCVLPAGTQPVHSWPYIAGKSAARVSVKPAFMAYNGELLRDAIAGDIGIGLLPTFLIYEDLRAGRIVEILKPYCVQKAWIYAVLPQRKYVPAKSRALIDFLKARYGTVPYWDL